MKYKVILEGFEGPLDLLYHLIEKEKVDIYDIPIAKITDQYIAYIETMQELDLEITSEFLVMAATLLEIKSKMLLPSKKEKDGEQLEMEESDPRAELVKRLIEYKKYKQAAEKLKDKEELHSKLYYKPKEEIEYLITDDDFTLEGLDLNKLIDSYKSILKKCIILDSQIDYKEIQRDEITIEESIENILDIINYRKKINFEELFEDKLTRSKIVVTFLALLELIKQKVIIIKQENNFDQIIIKLKKHCEE
ncbi:segregation and condensation protein A [Gottschalkia purinilytica]|nr:segregation/condensation protein A [Gottschalkia purinilytica]